MHFRRAPVASTLKLVEEASVATLRTGTQALTEDMAIPGGAGATHRLFGQRQAAGEGDHAGAIPHIIDADEAKDTLHALWIVSRTSPPGPPRSEARAGPGVPIRGARTRSNPR